uniref:Xyloside xylosyltransferase 1 n=1 Tax=Sinocyclocheilus grahami TaxID=75366 RepID=A0A672KN27_SINGR
LCFAFRKCVIVCVASAPQWCVLNVVLRALFVVQWAHTKNVRPSDICFTFSFFCTLELKRIVQLDLDLKFRSNIRDLFQEFNQFPTEAVIGIAREMQPVYRHTFWQYRKENPKSRVGDPPPDGLPGFNSGVMLLNLDSMRRSTLYNQLLEPERVARLAEKYHFRGHLGDQDFFTMIGMEHRELFYPLSCGWNRQLCTWWREHGYGDVFQLYYRCDGPVHIYHGNCNTAIPDY